MPKLYLSGGNLKPPQGGQVHVKYSYAAVFKSGSEVRSGLIDAVNESRLALDTTIGYMQTHGANGVSDRFKQWAGKYFLTDYSNGPSASEFDAIMAVLRLTNTGVNNSDLSVKVYNKSGGARGYVTTYHGSNANRSHRTPGAYNPGNGQLRQGYKGDIHMSVGGIKSDSLIATKLFIHEATHKFANTADFGESGYTDDDTGSFRAKGLTKEQALMNADSYGRFAVHFYRAENGLPQW